jgi:hypothetical protein
MKSKGLVRIFILAFLMMLFTSGANVSAEGEINPLSVTFAQGKSEVELVYKEGEYVAPSAADVVIGNCTGTCSVEIDGDVTLSEM